MIRKAQSLDCSASSSRSADGGRRGAGARAARARPPAPRRRAPRRRGADQVDRSPAAAPAGGLPLVPPAPPAAARGAPSAGGVVEAHQLQALGGGLLDHGRAATPPPRTTSARAARCRARTPPGRRPAAGPAPPRAAPRRRSRTRGHEVGRVRAGEGQRGVVLVGPAGVVPGVVVEGGEAVVVAVGAPGRVALLAPHQRDRGPVDRHEHAPRARPRAAAGAPRSPPRRRS